MNKFYWINPKGEKIDIDTMNMEELKSAFKSTVSKFHDYLNSIDTMKENKSKLYNELNQNYYDAMIEKEIHEMGFKSVEDYEYYLKTGEI